MSLLKLGLETHRLRLAPRSEFLLQRRHARRMRRAQRRLLFAVGAVGKVQFVQAGALQFRAALVVRPLVSIEGLLPLCFKGRLPRFELALLLLLFPPGEGEPRLMEPGRVRHVRLQFPQHVVLLQGGERVDDRQQHHCNHNRCAGREPDPGG